MLLVFLFLSSVSGSVPNSCLNCICDLDSDCQPSECRENGDSLTCGYYNIGMDYFIDCGHPGKEENENLELAWKRCAMDRECAKECVKGYFNRYKHKCSEFDECEAMSRLHIGGPDGCVKSNTWDYWKRVQRCCGCQ